MAGILTTNLICQKSKVDDIRRVTKLNICSAQLTDIGNVRYATNLQVLALSLNEISELGAISNCRRLREVYLRRNLISDINQVLHLSRLQGLEVLSLQDNPISKDPNYRRFVIAAIPSLERLDDVDITDPERRDALRVFPELTFFAPPASPYAEGFGGIPAPTPRQSQQQQQQQQQQRKSTSTPQQPQPHAIPRRGSSHADPSVPLEQRPRSRRASFHGTTSGGSPGKERSPPQHTSVSPGAPSSHTQQQQQQQQRQGLPPPNEESEERLVLVGKVLCEQLSPSGLLELRRYIDNILDQY